MKTRTDNAVTPVHETEPASSPKAHCGDGKGTGKGYRSMNQMHGTAFVKGETEQISISLFEKETTEG